MLERTHIPEARLVGGAGRSTRRRRGSTASPICWRRCPIEEIEHEPVVLPPRVRHEDYVRLPVPQSMIVPECY